MPASDSGHLGLPVIPVGGVGGRLVEWLEMSVMVVKLDDVTNTYSTGATVLTSFPVDIIPLSLKYRVAAPFRGDSEPILPFFEFGDSESVNKFGILNSAQLASTNSYGEIPLSWHASDTAGIDLTLSYHWGGDSETQTAASTGTLELWVEFRLNAGQPRLGGVRAK